MKTISCKTSQTSAEQPELLLASDICKLMRISRRTLDDWLYRGDIPAGTKLGQRLYWLRSDFNRWLSAQFEAGGAK